MADVFISYSRKDSDFVAKLEAALKTAGRDVWVDVEGIRASEDWKQKIFHEIDGANTFLFVVSPDSLHSEIANEEVSHAALSSKRMIPLFYRGSHDGTIPPALARFQGIQFSDDPLFPAGVSELLKTLATDIEWTDAHTRLLNRALEWELKAKERSYLLRGSDLRGAEQMVAKSADREPKLTTLQSEYILASRQSATKTQRIIIGAVAIALVIAVGLAVVALLNRNEAQRETVIAETNAAEAINQARIAKTNETKATEQEGIAKTNEAKAKQQGQLAKDNEKEAKKQQRVAEENARESRARELATYAGESLGEDPERSILLAMHAVDATVRFGQSPVPAA